MEAQEENDVGTPAQAQQVESKEIGVISDESESPWKGYLISVLND